MKTALRRTFSLAFVLALSAPLAASAKASSANTADDFVSLVAGSAKEKQAAWSRVKESFSVNQIPMLLDVLHLSNSRQLRSMGVQLMQETTGKIFGANLDDWYAWLWLQKEREDHPQLAEFKSKLWRHVDEKFAQYFGADRPTTIRLDEIRWGGVKQDGIPPLRNPALLPAKAAKYLAESNVVFGIEINGEARAYPKRIVAWHEMVTETVGGVPITAVYCTLCGTMVLFETKVDGIQHEVGTSGFLFRSNKLMYDQATQSLWNTFWGTPVVGPLVGKVELERRSVVTTTWGAWFRRHPETLVLNLETGHDRDYSEGAAYREYFATDTLMFTVPDPDKRLANKEEVFTLVTPGSNTEPLALTATFLEKTPVHHDHLGDLAIIVLTDISGANRAYQTGVHRFASWDQKTLATDTEGNQWTVTEAALIPSDGSPSLPRFPGQRAFWFGWHAAYPNTRLVGTP